MSTLKTAVLATAFALCAVPGALAAGSNLQLIIGGEAYDGPPKFEVTFDGKVLGEGAVNAAIDTATARLSSTTGDGATCASSSYSFAMAVQSVASGTRARAWHAAIAA